MSNTYLNYEGLAYYKSKSDELYATKAELTTMTGSPLVASTAAEMTDTSKVYVYTGSESGYTSGNWYYYNGSAWTSGGVYNASAVQTDTTLTVSGMAADSAAVGEELSDLKSALDEVEATSIPSGGTTGQVLAKASATDYDTRWITPSGGGGGGGTSDYDDLTNKPSINSVTLSGNKTTADLDLDEVFWAAHGTTTFSAVDTAYTAGKIVCVTKDSKTYILSRKTVNGSISVFNFSSGSSSGIDNITLDNSDSWSSGSTKAIPSPYTSTPAALGTASAGSSANYARGNHVHAMPTAADVGAAPAVTEVTISTSGAVSQALDAGKIYHFTGAVTSMSLTLNAAASGQLAQYHFDFESGSTAATVTITGVTWSGGSFVPEASKRYECDILNGYGVYLSW